MHKVTIIESFIDSFSCLSWLLLREWKDLGFFFKKFLQILRVFSLVAVTPVSLDVQLGENVFLFKLALLQQIFPASILWAHPMPSEFCKIFIHKAGRQAGSLFVRWKQWGLLKIHFVSSQVFWNWSLMQIHSSIHRSNLTWKFKWKG